MSAVRGKADMRFHRRLILPDDNLALKFFIDCVGASRDAEQPDFLHVLAARS
jgi:hypothetical protein